MISMNIQKIVKVKTLILDLKKNKHNVKLVVSEQIVSNFYLDVINDEAPQWLVLFQNLKQ